MIQPLTDKEFQNLTSTDINTIVTSRLKDMATQVNSLVDQGDYDTAEFLRNEGLLLAATADGHDTFFFINEDKMTRAN